MSLFVSLFSLSLCSLKRPSPRRILYWGEATLAGFVHVCCRCCLLKQTKRKKARSDTIISAGTIRQRMDTKSVPFQLGFLSLSMATKKVWENTWALLVTFLLYIYFMLVILNVSKSIVKQYSSSNVNCVAFFRDMNTATSRLQMGRQGSFSP